MISQRFPVASLKGIGKKWVFFTGARCSAASEFPTFRGKGGIWNEIDADAVASKKARYCGDILIARNDGSESWISFMTFSPYCKRFS